MHQRTLIKDTQNEPWGNCWALPKPTSLFHVLSKNTGTINLQNLDMQAIMKELTYLNTSVFAAQETNIHWDAETYQHLTTQCC